MKIGLISDGKYGERAFENFKREFEVIWIKVPEIPSNIILDEIVNVNIPDCDLYISYIRHPDLILQIAELQKPLILGITPGLGLAEQAKRINPKVISPRTMCSLEPNTGIDEIDEFALYFGRPKYEVLTNSQGLVRAIKVNRSSPCGSSLASANFIKSKSIKLNNLQNFALAVCHECRAPRFGHTCDKEISGMIHIISLINSVQFDGLDPETADFIVKINKEYNARIKN
ncbi:MAG: DUF166 family protein [Candidatus Hodarchaeota archaeon]